MKLTRFFFAFFFISS
ncbi:pheA operon leader peptide PheL [Salmonella enterica subsp. enterica serovar Bredeney]